MEKLNTLSNEMTEVKSTVGKLETGLESLSNEMTEVKSTVGKLETGLESVQKNQLRLEYRLESEVIEKIRALFDDRSMNQDYFISIRDTMARIENRVEFLARQNVEHIFKLQEHDRELRLLRAEKK